jgi:hypothetical protein
MNKIILTGINIQWPISRLILNGEKTVETRTYPLPQKYINTEMALVETPGKKGNFQARTIAVIKFARCFKYTGEEDFDKDLHRHQVTADSMWAWTDEKPKWGWEVSIVKILEKPLVCSSKGIVYRKNINIQY